MEQSNNSRMLLGTLPKKFEAFNVLTVYSAAAEPSNDNSKNIHIIPLLILFLWSFSYE